MLLCVFVNAQKTQVAASSSLSSGTIASPLQGFHLVVSNLHTDVTVDDVMVSSINDIQSHEKKFRLTVNTQNLKHHYKTVYSLHADRR